MSQRMSTARLTGSVAKQLPDRRRGGALDNHRSRPVRNHATFARGVLTSCMNRIMGRASQPFRRVPTALAIKNDH